jgi:hypothetical protein
MTFYQCLTCQGVRFQFTSDLRLEVSSYYSTFDIVLSGQNLKIKAKLIIISPDSRLNAANLRDRMLHHQMRGQFLLAGIYVRQESATQW